MTDPKDMKPTSSEKQTDSLGALRRKAEEKLRTQDEKLKKLSSHDIRDLVHELGTHQIELEMQNEELRRAQEELEASRSRYAELYEFAPVGYFTFNTRGLIREVNLTGANQLGTKGRLLINVPFARFIAGSGDRRIFSAHRKEAFTTQARQSCEIRLRNKDGAVFDAQLQSLAVENIDDKAGSVRTAVIDITDRKRLEEEREKLVRELQASLAKIKTLKELLPICSYCKKIRDDEGYWQQVEKYIIEHTDTSFTHGICPECYEKVKGELSTLKKRS